MSVYVKCCIPNCADIPTNTRHRFPNPEKHMDRFKKWLDAVNTPELNNMDPMAVFSSKRICRIHFEHKFISTRSRKLQLNAVPTLFLQNESKTSVGRSSVMGSQQVEIISQAQIKIEQEWEDGINIKQQEGTYLKIEEKVDVTKDSCTVPYTDIETQLFSDNSFKIEEEEIHIKNESELVLGEADKNSNNFEEGGCQQCFTNDEETYKCSKHTFSQESNLETPSLAHSSEKNYVCIVCEKSFAHIVNLNQHLPIHFNVKKIKCDVCKKSFTQKAHLKKHLLIHSGVKNFKCDVCEKSFTQKSYLKLHLLIHSCVKNFKCEVCEKSFTQKSSLNLHLLIHSGVKNFKCDVCEKSFTQKSYLKLHLLIHSGVKNFKCDVCEKSFTQKPHLKKHLLIHSRVKNFV